jgi:hypothetical protein
MVSEPVFPEEIFANAGVQPYIPSHKQKFDDNPKIVARGSNLGFGLWFSVIELYRA